MQGWLDWNSGKQEKIGSPPDKLTLTLIGEPGTGKTSIKNRIVGKDFSSDELMTVGAEFTFHGLHIAEQLVKLKICDIAGQTSFSTIRSHYMIRSHAALMIFDLTSFRSFERCVDWINAYLEANVNAQSNLPILLVGNKSDLINNRKVSVADIREFLEQMTPDNRIADHIIGYIEMSAKTGDNVDLGINKITRSVHLMAG